MSACDGFPGHVLRYRAGQTRATCACGALVDVPYHSGQVAPVLPEDHPAWPATAYDAGGPPGVSDLAPADVMPFRAGFYFGTLQRIMQVLGPTAPDSAECCAGCSYEIGEALRLLRAAGVEYHHRSAGNPADESRPAGR